MKRLKAHATPLPGNPTSSTLHVLPLFHPKTPPRTKLKFAILGQNRPYNRSRQKKVTRRTATNLTGTQNHPHAGVSSMQVKGRAHERRTESNSIANSERNRPPILKHLSQLCSNTSSNMQILHADEAPAARHSATILENVPKAPAARHSAAILLNAPKAPAARHSATILENVPEAPAARHSAIRQKKVIRHAVTNLSNRGLISEDRSTKATQLFTIPRSCLSRLHRIYL